MPGFKTNHSLRVANVARLLFQSGAEEQLIMERTGHCSIDGVHAYKQTSEEQHIFVSGVLNSATNGTLSQPKLPKKPNLDMPVEQSTSVTTTPLNQHRLVLNMSFTSYNLGTPTDS